MLNGWAAAGYRTMLDALIPASALLKQLPILWKASKPNIMHPSMARQTNMNKENAHASNIKEPAKRITRAQAKALGMSGNLPPLNSRVKQEFRHKLQPNSKRGSSDNKSTNVGSNSQSKRRVVLKDVTNMPFNDLNMKIINDIKIQTSKQTRANVARKNAMVAPAVYVGPWDHKGKTKAEDANWHSSC